jgi:AI-2 transport protein TqsA
MKQARTSAVGLVRSSQVVLAFAAIAGLLYYGRPVLLPFVLAVFLFSMFSPILDWLVLRLRFPRLLALVASFALVLVVAVIIFLTIVEAIRRVVATATAYSDSLIVLIEQIFAQIQRWGLMVEPKHFAGSLEETIPAMMTEIAGRSLGIIAAFSLMLIFLFFLMASRDPHEVREGVYASIDRDVRRYLLTKTALSAIMGIAVGGVLGLFGIPLAVVFGLLAFLLDFIPSVGPVIATLLPVPVAIAQYPDSIWTALSIVALLATIQIVQGNFVEPKVLGSSLHLHPVVILLAIGFWGLVWGITGALLAVPLTAILRLVSLRIDALRPFGRLLGGRIPDIAAPPLPVKTNTESS